MPGRGDRMEYKANINGIDVSASFSDFSIKEIFIPLLERLSDISRSKNGRVIAMLAAPPGAGKSTLVSFLEYLSKEIIPEHTVQAIGMDGFHKKQEYLLTHMAIVDGKEIPMVDIKGAPITFDLDGLKKRISEVSGKEKCGWPIYDRILHNPVDNVIDVTGDIVLLEGNYLLLDIDEWTDISRYADYTVAIRAEEELLRRRLIERKIASGNTKEKAEKFVDFSDMANVRVCLEQTKKADLELLVGEDNQYTQYKH